jgi:4-amino-4-deoxy-L-arabinose transferase-like glycosyltransferase
MSVTSRIYWGLLIFGLVIALDVIIIRIWRVYRRLLGSHKETGKNINRWGLLKEATKIEFSSDFWKIFQNNTNKDEHIPQAQDGGETGKNSTSKFRGHPRDPTHGDGSFRDRAALTPEMKNTLRSFGEIIGLLVASLLLFTGILLMRGDVPVLGFVLVILTVTAFLVITRNLEKKDISFEDAAGLRPYLGPMIAGTASLFLIIATIYQLAISLNSDVKEPIRNILMWVASLATFGACVLWLDHWHLPRRAQIAAWLKAHRQEIAIVAGIFVVSLFLRIFALEQHPYPWSGDEASVGTEGWRILNGQVGSLFATGWSGQPNLSFVSTALSLAIWGHRMFAVRMASAIFGALTTISLYLLGREAFNRKVATLAAAFLAVFPYHIHFSRIGVNNIMDGFNITLVLWLLFRGLRKDHLVDYACAGLATGLALYTYVGSRLVIALAFASLVYFVISRKGYLQTHWKHLVMFLAGTVFTAAPVSYYFIKHPDNFMTRIGQENIFLNNWLSIEAQRKGMSVFQIIADQVSKTTLVFIAREAHGNFFNSPEPYLTILGSIFFLLGMGFAIQHFFKPRYFILMMWFWAVVILGGILTPSPPANARMFMTTPAIALFLGVGIWQVSEVLRRLRFKNGWIAALNVLLMGVLAFQGISFYFGRYRESNGFQDANSELAMEAGLELQALGPGIDFYMLGLPRIFAGFPTIPFLNPDTPLFDLTDDFPSNLQLSLDRGAFFVAIPENRAALDHIVELFPGGEWRVMQRKTKFEVLYYAYILPPSSVQETGIP